MGNTPLAGLIRSILAALGGIAIAFGIIDDPATVEALTNDIVTIVGGVSVVVVTIHSILSKLKSVKK